MDFELLKCYVCYSILPMSFFYFALICQGYSTLFVFSEAISSQINLKSLVLDLRARSLTLITIHCLAIYAIQAILSASVAMVFQCFCQCTM